MIHAERRATNMRVPMLEQEPREAKKLVKELQDAVATTEHKHTAQW